ncbi:MAG: c-type cytochrome [Chitinophagaceae bacterium]|nr:c-type cytochrome [Chitinophagaceae bacterium]
MRKNLRLFGCIAMSAAIIIGCNDTPQETAVTTPEAAKTGNASMIKRGEYLVATIGCDDCHSPKSMGPNGPEIIAESRLSGYPASRPVQKTDGLANELAKGWHFLGGDVTNAAGPWGVSFAANITPDKTGIGSWTEAQFVKALREGKYKGLDSGRALLPPMPWKAYKNLNDEDLKSMFAYLKSIKPVSNLVPNPIPPAMPPTK